MPLTVLYMFHRIIYISTQGHSKLLTLYFAFINMFTNIARQPAFPLVIDRYREFDRHALFLHIHPASSRVASVVHVA